MKRSINQIGESVNTETVKSSDLFSSRLKDLRQSFGMNQTDFARVLGINKPQTYHRYENGRIPKAEILEKISMRCNVSVDWLLGNDKAMQKNVIKKLRDRHGLPPGAMAVMSSDGKVPLWAPEEVRESVAKIARIYKVDQELIFNKLSELMSEINK